MRKQRWTADDRRAFAEQPLRAQTIPSRRWDGPDADEWDLCFETTRDEQVHRLRAMGVNLSLDSER